MATLTLISESPDEFGDSTTVMTAVAGIDFPCYLRLRRTVSGPTRAGDIAASLTNQFTGATIIAFFSGQMGLDGDYPVPDFPGNPPPVPNLVVTLDVSDGQGYSEKVYFFEPTSLQRLQGAIIDCEGFPRVGVSVLFDPLKADGTIERLRIPRPLSVPTDDVVLSSHPLAVVTDEQGAFELELQPNTRIAPPPTKYLVTIRDHPPEIFPIELPEEEGAVNVEDLLE